jgi:DNA-binding IclR family transcriptional regulator
MPKRYQAQVARGRRVAVALAVAGQPCRVGTLAVACDMDRVAVQNALGRLKALGLVEPVADNGAVFWALAGPLAEETGDECNGADA